MASENYHIQGRIWVESSNGPLLGWGRVKLLEEIQKSGSITKAAQSMNMSYKQAWNLIDSINQSSPSPFVTKSKGGQGGGGAVLTIAGENAILEFKRIENEFREFLQSQTDALDR